jgi:methyl-accepting chemotaxis protein
MTFISHIGIAFGLLIFGALMAVSPGSSPDVAKWSFLAGAVAAQLWLFRTALVFRARRVPRFDMLVASELIVAFGVFSLITGIIISGVAVLRDVSRFTASPLQVLQFVLVPFGEGLLASGLAPLLASVLRQVEVLRYGVDEGSARDGEPDLPGLTAQVREATAALDTFAAAWKRCETVLDGAGGTLKTSADTYAKAAQRVDKALTDLSKEIEESSRAPFKEMNARAAATAKALDELTRNTTAFSDAAVDGTHLLTGLQKLIEAVTNFVRPDDRPRP